jgi:tetratricopeptide (TPR) repeat protein
MRLAISIAVALSLVLASVGGATAADEKKKKKSRKRSYVLSEQTARKMLKFGELAEEERYEEALEVLDRLAKKSRLKKHDRAMIYQNRAYMLAALERYPEARESLEIALEQDALPDVSTNAIRFNLAQLYMSEEKFQKAVGMFELWIATAENPGAQAEFYMAAAYAQTEQYDKALPHARLAVAKSKSPVEQYMAVQLALEFQSGNLLESLDLLKQLATLFPRKRYYMQLAYSYSSMGEEGQALAMLELADVQGFIEKNDEVVNLAQRYMFQSLPYQAAKIVEKAFDDGIMEETSENYELLANSLLHAREYDSALDPLAKAAEMAEDGDLYIRLAQVYLEVENWKSARAALEAAVDKGGLRDPGNAQLLLGISNFNEKRFQSARTAFQTAMKDDNTAKSAKRWLEHVNREINKESDLEG